MQEQNVYSPSITVRVIYKDRPDLIELETCVRAKEWRGRATAYTSPIGLRDDAAGLAIWAREPVREFTIEAGADTGIGWLMLRFYTVDAAGHVWCQVTLATDRANSLNEVSRLIFSMPTEPGLIERFARHLAALSETFEGDAVLDGLAA